ncbi:hypothetical protein NF556_07085 [Ornithinimicrobium faecis]|uniref:Uncharacterized protein n=1 Tax=Ornithinimicrobium faecis TaxID=2934158 RepID=A0ABY4YXC6_9MICO|nr:hypothetical protein [Ornithinimicrobium sp. HY1793]USQ81406.1 hypothetical protein NF556_07085 [Ornithinimicrobium sp. HY1793]
MGLFDKIKKAFDTGGIKVDLEAPKKFDWSDPTIPVRVTLTGHESEARSVQQLSFSLKDDGDNEGAPGMRNNDGPSRGDGRRFSATYVHLLALQLAPGETQTFDVNIPLAANGGPGLINRMSFTNGGVTLHFGDQWYVLSVSAPVDGANMARADKVRLRASGRLGDRHAQFS